MMLVSSQKLRVTSKNDAEQWGQLSNGVSTDEIINQQIMISGTDPLAPDVTFSLKN